jgi:hypothetical protein
MRYWPNPAHKKQTTEAGPPRWWPDKTPCPDDLTIAERDELLLTSVPRDPGDAHSPRFNVRSGLAGLEAYEAKWTRDVEGEPEFHGYPTHRVPTRVLRVMRDRGTITEREYRQMLRMFG